MGRKRTLSELAQHIEDVFGVARVALDEERLDEEGGSAVYRVAPLVVRRRFITQRDPPAAYLRESEVDARLILSAHVGSAGNAEMEAIRDALKARFGVSSDAEMHRRVYALVGELLGVE